MFLKVSDKAEELLTGLDALERWPDKVKLMQRNGSASPRG